MTILSTRCLINYKIYLKEHFRAFHIVWNGVVWKGSSVLTVTLFALSPQYRARYKKVKLQSKEDNNKLCKNIYPCI